jgi:hypothetical protein
MSFLTPEIFNKAVKSVMLKGTSVDSARMPERIKDKLLYLLNGEVQRQDDVILKTCSLGLPLGYSVRLNVDVEYFGYWYFEIDLKLVDCIIRSCDRLHIEYFFELADIRGPEYATGERWDDEMKCYMNPEINDLLELPVMDLIVNLLNSKYGRNQ